MKRQNEALGFLIPIVVAFVVVYCCFAFLLRSTSAGKARVVEVGRVPQNSMENPFTTAVLPGSGDVLVFSERLTQPGDFFYKAGELTPPGVPSNTSHLLMYRVDKAASIKLLDISGGCSPAIINNVKESFTPDRKYLLVEYPCPNHYQLGLVEMKSGRVLWKRPYCSQSMIVECPFSDDGKQFVAEREESDNDLWTFDTLTGKPVKQITKLPKHVERSYSYAGFVRGFRRIQYEERQGPKGFKYACDLVSNKRTTIRKLPGEWSYPSPSGDRYVTTTKKHPSLRNFFENGEVVLKDSSSRKIRTLYTSHGDEEVYLFAWSPDGRFMALNSYPNSSRWMIPGQGDPHMFVLIIDTLSGRIVSRYQRRGGDVNMIDWYPDSSGIVCLYEEGGMCVVTKLRVK